MQVSTPSSPKTATKRQWISSRGEVVTLVEDDLASQGAGASVLSLARPATFWVVVLWGRGGRCAAAWHPPPIRGGMVLAYLLDPLATRLERLGFNRVFATLLIVGAFIGCSVALVVLTAPFLVSEMASLVDNLPLYIRRLHELATDPSRPWLSKVIGEGLGYAEKSFGEVTTLASDWSARS